MCSLQLDTGKSFFWLCFREKKRKNWHMVLINAQTTRCTARNAGNGQRVLRCIFSTECNNTNSQPDATITNFTDNYNQLNIFRAIISPILRSTRLWYNAPTTLPAGNIAGALYHKLWTQSSAPEDGRNYRPKHVELIVIINKICYCCI